MNITFVGHGYVGLVTACVFADFGNTVYVIGHTPEKIDKLKNGDPIIYEPGLKELLQKNIRAKRLIFTLNYEDAIPASDVVFIAVGTPPKQSGEADLSSVFNVAESIGKHLKTGFTVVSCKSTVPVGTNRKVEQIINGVKKPEAEIAMVSCPEFLREGSALTDTFNPDRIVLGSDSKKAITIMTELHKPITGKRVTVDIPSAELIKYTSNAMLATKISFANLISFYCEKTDADVEMVLDAVGLDKRIGRIFLSPGIGYGGSCFPKDVQALMNTGNELGINTTLLQAVEEINKSAQENFVHKVLSSAKGKKIAMWGLAFKPNTDDIRFAPSHTLIKTLLQKGYEISAYDPAAMENMKSIYGSDIQFMESPYQVVHDADALCILTEWNEFMQADLGFVQKEMRHPLIIDGRNIYIPEKMRKLGFDYISTGRQAISQ
jgi:UDPglucose 6-dehydrogenase